VIIHDYIFKLRFLTVSPLLTTSDNRHKLSPLTVARCLTRWQKQLYHMVVEALIRRCATSCVVCIATCRLTLVLFAAETPVKGWNASHGMPFACTGMCIPSLPQTNSPPATLQIFAKKFFPLLWQGNRDATCKCAVASLLWSVCCHLHLSFLF